MAEFQVVMKQAKRMCEAQGCSCGECGLHKKYNLCPLCAHQDDLIPADWELSNLNDIERIVMDWAENNPEPRYPTWKEWQERTFPDALCDMCPRMFGIAPMDGCVNMSCDDCTNAHIPADIAEKLGLKLIGGEE